MLAAAVQPVDRGQHPQRLPGAELEPELRALTEEGAGALGRPRRRHGTSPSTLAVPAVGCRMPVSILIEVDFPRTVGADEGEPLTTGHRERQVVDRVDAAGGPAEPLVVIPAASMPGHLPALRHPHRPIILP